MVTFPLFLLIFTCITTPTHAFSLAEWLNNPPYANGGTIQEQINCYALPYGAIGFSSHVLTYLTVFALSLGRDPLTPWRPLRHKRFDISIAVVGFIVSFTMTVLTMLRCRNTWPFILIAVWKQVFSTTLTVMAVHAARTVIRSGVPPTDDEALPLRNNQQPMGQQDPKGRNRQNWEPDLYPPSQPYDDETQLRDGADYQGEFQRIWWWCVPYSLGAIVGAVGIFALVRNNLSSNRQLQIITGVFGGVALTLVLADVGIYWTASRWSGSRTQLSRL